MKYLLLAAFFVFSFSLSAQDEYYVSTLAELQTELEQERSGDIVVTNKITLTDGTNLDGHGRTIRVPQPYLKEDGTVNTVKDDAGYLRNSSEDATTTDNGNVFTIASGAIVTLKDMTIMGGRIKFADYPNASIKTDDDGIEWDRVDTKSGSGKGPEYAANAAVVVQTGGTLTMTDCTVTRSNRGIHNYQGTVVLDHCNLIRNYCRFGSGVLNDGGTVADGAVIVMDRCSFSENRSYMDGSAAENKAGGVMYINNSTVSNNASARLVINNYSNNLTNYPSKLYFMNCTISGNLLYSTSLAWCAGNGPFYAVNSIMTDNVYMYRGTGTKSYALIGNKTSPKGNLLSCITNTQETSYANYTNCKTTTATDIFADYVSQGLALNYMTVSYGTTDYNTWATCLITTRFSNAFDHTALVNKDGHYSAPVTENGPAATGGCKTYFDYTLNGSTLTVHMSYGDDNTSIIDGSDPSTQEVTTYIDGTTRTAGIIGSSPVVSTTEQSTTETYYTLYLDPDFTGGNVDGATVYGDTYVEGKELTVTAVSQTGYAFKGWYVKQGDNDYPETMVTDNPYVFNITARTTIKPVFKAPHYHNWVYAENETDATAVYAYCTYNVEPCVNYGTAEDHSNVLTLSVAPPPILQTNTKNKYAVVSTSKAWPADYSVAYYSSDTEGATDGGTYLGDGVYPVESGYYYAIVTTGAEGNYVYAKVAFTLTSLTITGNQDPNNTDDYYSTFYSSVYNYLFPSNLTNAYTATVTVTDGDTQLTLTPLEGGIIPKSTAVILKGTRLNSTDVKTTTFAMEPTQNTATLDGENDLCGCDEVTAVSDLPCASGNYNIYTLSAVFYTDEDRTQGTPRLGFYRYKGTSIGANKAYLPVPKSSSVRGFPFMFDEDDTVITGIPDLLTTFPLGAAGIYSPSGVRLSHPVPGLNIINGKKVYVKGYANE